MSDVEDGESCLPCKYNIGVGMALGICEQAKVDNIDCAEIKQDYLAEKITAQDVMTKLLNSLDNDGVKNQIKELETLMGLNSE